MLFLIIYCATLFSHNYRKKVEKVAGPLLLSIVLLYVCAYITLLHPPILPEQVTLHHK